MRKGGLVVGNDEGGGGVVGNDEGGMVGNDEGGEGWQEIVKGGRGGRK